MMQGTINISKRKEAQKKLLKNTTKSYKSNLGEIEFIINNTDYKLIKFKNDENVYFVKNDDVINFDTTIYDYYIIT